MKATQEQLEEQRNKLKSFLEKAEYDHFMEDGLIEDLKMRLRVFTLCMQRTIAGGFDPPSEEEIISLSDYWYEINGNLITALELLDMANCTMQGIKHNGDQLKNKFNGTNNS